MGGASLLIFALAVAAVGGDAKPESRAQQLFEKGEMAFAQGRLDEARRYLEEAYRLDPDPVLLYNLARVEESSGRNEAALTRYKEYLRKFPTAEFRQLVSRRVQIMEADKRARQAKAADVRTYGKPPASPRLSVAEPEEDDDGPSLAGPITFLSIGVASLATGIVFGVLSQSRYDDASAASDQSTALSRFEESQDFGRNANIAYAVAGGAAVTGALWWIIQETAD